VSTDSRYRKRAEADRRRRQVRTMNGGRPGTTKVRRKRRKGRKAKLPRVRMGGPGTMLWGVIALALCLVALLAQSILWGVFALLSIGLTAAVNRVESRQLGGRSGTPAPPRKVAPKSGKGATSGRSGSSGTRRPRTSGSVCSEACKRSPKPKSTCRCRSPRCQHGSMSGAAGAVVPMRKPSGSAPGRSRPGP
jgi:hypothetical protein